MQNQFIYSEVVEKPFMRIYPTKNNKFYISNNLQRDELIVKGSKLVVKRLFANQFIPNPHFRIYIASLGS